MDIKTHKPKSIKEAIDDLQMFLECDLYSKFRPETELKGKVWLREDVIKDEEEFLKYMNDHFNILRKQVKKLNSHLTKQTNQQGSCDIAYCASEADRRDKVKTGDVNGNNHGITLSKEKGV